MRREPGPPTGSVHLRERVAAARERGDEARARKLDARAQRLTPVVGGTTRELLALLDVAVLCGTDYNDGVRGYGPVTALDAAREHGDLWGVVEAAGLDADGSIDVADAETARALFLAPDVTDDYAIDRTVAPDLERVREYVVGEWEIPETAVATAFERLEACTPLSV